MKKAIGLLLIVAMLVMLSSCKDKNNSSDSSGSESKSTTPNKDTTTNSPENSDSLNKPPLLNKDIDFDMTPLDLNPKMNIVSRKGDVLYDGDKPLRFISVNTPTVLDSNPFEQEDLIKSVAQMGGQVVRTYTFSVTIKSKNDKTAAYINDIDTYNENAFLRLDNLLAICNKYGVRVIIPFIDSYEYNGGIPAFLELYGKTVTKDIAKDSDTFFSDSEVVQGFYNFVEHVLNRTNSITGVKYKDDPAILAWESGNELRGSQPRYNTWMQGLTKVIKNNDKNHLISDGWFGIRPHSLVDPNIDIVSHHYYPHILKHGFETELENNLKEIDGQKVYYVGEFGFVETPEIESFYEKLIKSKAAGSLIWSLRGHDHRGGFYQHSENEVYSSYHWPGFSEGERYDEKGLLQLTYLKGYEIQNKKPKIVAIPEKPQIIAPIINPSIRISWLGSTGAYGYDIERAESSKGPWTLIGSDLSDDYSYAAIMFKDSSTDIQIGKPYYYRIRAKSIGGISEWSEPVEGVVK